MTTPSGTPRPTSILEHALWYAAKNWRVIPVIGKAPAGGFGTHHASNDADVIRGWWAQFPIANVGIVCDDETQVLDVDPRHTGDQTLETLVAKHGPLPETLTTITGGGGRHYWFRIPAGMRIRRVGPGCDAIVNNKYVVSPPSVHPDTKQLYEWSSDGDPIESDIQIALAPSWILEPVLQSAQAPTLSVIGYLPQDRVAELREALAYLDADDYHAWLEVGMALHSTDAPEGWALWNEWSARSSKFDPVALAKKWASYGRYGARRLHVESVFAKAMAAGWRNRAAAPEAVPVATVRPLPPEALHEISPPPGELLKLPGALGDFVTWVNRSAPKPQPLFAVTAALSFASIVAARRWTTSLGNWPALFFLNVGKSGCGKEHARTAIERALTACQLGDLLGPAGYTSDSAVFSALMHQPAHLSIIDEFGELLSAAKAEGNHHRRQALTMLMEVWGRANGTLRAQGYSTMGLSASAAKEMAKRRVERPSLTLLAMTTPDGFYNALDENAVKGGFLNRLIVVETHIGRQSFGVCEAEPFDPVLADWAAIVRGKMLGNLAAIDVGADLVPNARMVGIRPDARGLWDRYAADCLRAMDELEQFGLSELEGRSAEKAIRIAMLLALSDAPNEPEIFVPHMDWAIQFVRWSTQQTISACRRRLFGSKFDAQKEGVYASIRASAETGRSDSELSKFNRIFRSLTVRDRNSILDALVHEKRIARVAIPKTRGPARQAWIAVREDDEEEAA